MHLFDVWPLFRLRLITPRLELRVVRDEDLGGLADAARSGIHDPAVMPFGSPWTDQPERELVRGMAKWQWEQRASVRPDNWKLNLGVFREGMPIGIQDVSAHKFAMLKTVSSGSWMTRSQHGQGLGTEMRAAMLMFVFDHLEAQVAESAAAAWNTSSLGVSRKLGYRENGISRHESRPGEVMVVQAVRLERANFVRPDWVLVAEGIDEARDELLLPA